MCAVHFLSANASGNEIGYLAGHLDKDSVGAREHVAVFRFSWECEVRKVVVDCS
jgi:hypothetical protein